jgi:hypothetical protein
MTYDSTIFRGASIRLNSTADSAEADQSNLLSLPSVKRVWPMSIYSLPDHEVVWTGSTTDRTQNVKRQENATDTFSPHVMVQVDKLRAQGIIGEGIKIGIVDTGVSFNSSS